MDIVGKKRSWLADPESRESRVNYIREAARAGKYDVLVECLKSGSLLNKASAPEQDYAFNEVSRRLGIDWKLKEVRDWSCFNEHEVGSSVYTKDISHRLATFTHRLSGVDFQLLPGRNCVKNKMHDGPGSSCSCLKPFLIARWPVTNDQAWRTHPRNGLGENGQYDSELSIGPLPAVGAEFGEARSYAKDLGFSIPTPTEWRYACRAGSTTKFYWGDEFDSSHVWHDENSLEQCGCPVQGGGNMIHCNIHGDMRRRPHAPAEHDKAGKWNAFGLVDMIGNIWEWVDSREPNGEEQIIGAEFDSSERGCERWQTFARASRGYYDSIGFRPIMRLKWRLN